MSERSERIIDTVRSRHLCTRAAAIASYNWRVHK
jgi:hypothetical protein